MSVRAYRINNIDYKEGESFNLWHDTRLMDFLEENGFCDTLNEGTGIAEIPVSVLEKALQKAKELEIEETYIEQELKYDIEWAKKRGEDYIRYYCF